MIDLESLYSGRRILTEKSIDDARVVTAISQGELNFSNHRRVGGQYRPGLERSLLVRARTQTNSPPDQKYEPGKFYHTFFDLLCSCLVREWQPHLVK
jgi:hypothetical protein